MTAVGCMRLCSRGPLIRIDPDSQLYQHVNANVAPSVIGGLKGGTVEAERGDLHSPFFEIQASVVLENCGRIKPNESKPSIAAGGYQGLHHAFAGETTPMKVVETITRSGLRGRRRRRLSDRREVGHRRQELGHAENSSSAMRMRVIPAHS